jgi:4-amino-4-deoxy-L-arabinose transferase-like glycosyltransferase
MGPAGRLSEISHAVEPAGSGFDLRGEEATSLAAEKRCSAGGVVGWSLILFLIARAAGHLAVLASTWLEPGLKVSKAYSAWDGYWYLRIAQHGYPPNIASEKGGNEWAFFPGLPAAMRVTNRVTGLSYLHSGILLGWVFGAASAVAVGLMVREVLGRDTALRTVALLVFFPSAFVLGMIYTEGLFIAAAATCLLCIRRRWWISAAILADVACLTRNMGVVLVAAIAVEGLLWCRTTTQRLKMLGVIALASVGFIGWCSYAAARTGHPFAFVDAEKDWGGARFIWFQTPFKSLYHLATSRAAWHSATVVTSGLALLLVAVGFVYLIRLDRVGPRVPISWWVYSVGGALFAFSPFWANAVMRYTMVLIPLLAAFAHLARTRLAEVTIGAFALFQGAFAVVVLVSLVNGHAVTAP